MQTALIVGANGKISIEATKTFSESSSFNVDLLLRNAHRIPDYTSSRITVFEGNTKDVEGLEKALDQVDIAFASLSESPDREAQAIIDTLNKKNVKRLIFVAAPGIYDELPDKLNTFNKEQFGEKLTKYRRAADLIEASDLDCTITRPAWLTFKNESGHKATQKGDTFKGIEVSRRSVASLAVRIAKQPELYSRQNIGVNKPNTDGDKPA